MRLSAATALLACALAQPVVAEDGDRGTRRDMTCESIGTAARLLLGAGSDTDVLHLDAPVADIQASDVMTAVIVCPNAPRVLCMQFSADFTIGQPVSVAGSLRYADESYVVLDPCQVAAAD